MKNKIIFVLLLLAILLPLLSGCMGMTLKTPYDIAVLNGFKGTEEEWLASLKGDSAYEVWLKAGHVGTEEDFLASLTLTVNEHNVEVNAEDTLPLSTSKALLSVCSVYSSFSRDVIVRNGYQLQTMTQTYRSAGSGVIYQLDKVNGNAYIITNYHVVYDSQNQSTASGVSRDISLYLYGREYEQYAIPATYVGGSVYYDIAVLKVENSEVLRESDVFAATLMPENEEVTVGQTAIAVGNPEAFGISATSGIVCVDSESISMNAADGSAVAMRVLRIDTAINSGNSGGGLFNAKGELIGVTNAKIISAGTENIAYAIPVKVATRVANNIIDYCSDGSHSAMQRCILGITVGTMASSAEYDIETGIVSVRETVNVVSVSEGSLAEGNLEVNDIITAITLNGVQYPITRTFMLSDALLNARLNDEIVLHINRQGVDTDVTLTVNQNSIYDY